MLPLILIGCCVSVCGLGSQVHAANGDSVRLPMLRGNKPGYSPDTGIQVLLDSQWAGSRGYRHMEVTASVAKPATADTQITIRFFAGSWRYRDKAISVEKDFELKQGTTTAKMKFSVPQLTDWNTFGWETWVDGVLDESLSVEAMGFNAGTNGATAVGRFDMDTQQWRRGGAGLVQTVVSNAADVQQLDLSSLPDTWIDYSTLDVVTTSVSALERARVSAPEKLQAMLRWVRAGGNLWVTDVGQDFEDLDKLVKIINPGTQNEEPNVAAEVAGLGNWKFLALNDSGRTRLNDTVNLLMDQKSSEKKLSMSQIVDSKFLETASDSRHWFVARAFGLGTIVAIQELDRRRQPQESSVAFAIQRSAMSDNLDWSTRHGNDPGTGNPNFNHLLIEDVGAAPVFEFQLLISLFAIGIGPVNYWLLKRRNQLPVLLLTVPLAALGTTILLFSYGFLADGIEARVRARSLTFVDQVAGESASWARLSYYAGIAPADGLKMPADTTVYPILPSRSEYNAFGRQQINQQRSMEWNRQQLLTLGWLGSRTPTQYLTVSARPTARQLEIEQYLDGLSIVNQLGTEILALIVQDQDGKVFFGEEIDVDAKAALKPSSYEAGSATLRRFMTENLPQLPAGYVESNRRVRQSDYGASITESLMELQLEAIASPQAIGWGNRTYIAITSQGIDLALGLEDIQETNSFHVVRGNW